LSQLVNAQIRHSIRGEAGCEILNIHTVRRRFLSWHWSRRGPKKQQGLHLMIISGNILKKAWVPKRSLCSGLWTVGTGLVHHPSIQKRNKERALS